MDEEGRREKGGMAGDEGIWKEEDEGRGGLEEGGRREEEKEKEG